MIFMLNRLNIIGPTCCARTLISVRTITTATRSRPISSVCSVPRKGSAYLRTRRVPLVQLSKRFGIAMSWTAAGRTRRMAKALPRLLRFPGEYSGANVIVRGLVSCTSGSATGSYVAEPLWRQIRRFEPESPLMEHASFRRSATRRLPT